MEENLYNRLVYLDHNILDKMTKGDPNGIGNLFRDGDFIAAYSNENLSEIKRSIGYEDTFLKVLKEIGARKIIPDMDNMFRCLGTAQIHEGDPFDFYNCFKNEVDDMPEFGYGMGGMVRKMYGGMGEHTFSDIFENGIQEIGDLTQITEEDIYKLDIGVSEKEELKEALKLLPVILKNLYSDLGTKLDNSFVESAIKDFESTTGIGPMVLKNITGPNIINTVWEQVKGSFSGSDTTLEKFFGLDQSEWSNEPDRELSAAEKVNAIYHQLNYIGYFRDSDMKKKRRAIASFSDMTHAGMATFCKIFICGDEGLIKKAEAAYEYLGLGTKIVYIKNKN